MKEVTCRSALSPCGLKSITYSLSAYRGCSFGCAFCYSPSVLHETREWGTFLEAKVNVPEVLRLEVKKKKKGLVWLSAVTDPYQPAEERFELTKRCLLVLKGVQWPVTIQTRSPMVTRDKDLIAEFEKADVGFSVSTLDEKYRRVFEPRSPPSLDRFKAMRELSNRGIRTWLFLGPILPGVTGTEVDEIVGLAKGSGARTVQFDRLRFKPGVWERISNVVPEELRKEFEFSRERGHRYFAPIEERVRRKCKEHELKMESAF